MPSRGLDAITGILVRACGDLITGTAQAETEHEQAALIRVGYGHRDFFKEAVRGYVAAHNREHGSKVTVTFPSNFQIKLRVRRRTAPPAR